MQDNMLERSDKLDNAHPAFSSQSIHSLVRKDARNACISMDMHKAWLIGEIESSLIKSE